MLDKIDDLRFFNLFYENDTKFFSFNL